MYAQCPHCRTVYAVSAGQLGTTGGRVRCGHCFKPFNAHDQLVADAGEIIMDDSSQNTEAPIAADVLRQQAPLSVDDWPAPAINAEPEPPPRPPDAEEAERSPPLKPKRKADNAVREPRKTAGKTAEPPAPPVSGETVVPELLQDDLSQLLSARGPSWLVRLAQWSIVVFLVLLVAAQYAWFMPKEVLARLPVSRPGLTWVYGQLGRDLPMPRDISRIHLLSRDVRVHPDYGNVLLVNAKLVNRASYPQPFPTVRLVLFGVNGRVIASRGFRPEEYLPSSLASADAMEPDRPVLVGMEVVAPGTNAVSYEFQFL